MLAASLAVPPAVAKASGDAARSGLVAAKPVKLKPGCNRPGDRSRPKCAKFTQAEPKIVPRNGFFQFLAVPLVAGAGAVTVTATKNSKNCGNGSNSQNNGNCPASP